MMLSHLSFHLTMITISFPFTLGDTYPSLSYGSILWNVWWDTKPLKG